jgi:hypothetical protein
MKSTRNQHDVHIFININRRRFHSHNIAGTFIPYGMRSIVCVTINTRLALAAAATALALAAASSGCAHTTDGKAACPGCGTAAEPTGPRRQPSIVPTPKIILPEPAGPGDILPANPQGYVYVETKSGKTRCQLNSQSVGCESQFEDSPVVSGTHANSVSVDASGTVRWIVGNLGDIPAVTLDYRTYSATGWTIAAEETGTRFTNDETGHGMFVAVEGVESF